MSLVKLMKNNDVEKWRSSKAKSAFKKTKAAQ